jgi:hypothetical protein
MERSMRKSIVLLLLVSALGSPIASAASDDGLVRLIWRRETRNEGSDNAR